MAKAVISQECRFRLCLKCKAKDCTCECGHFNTASIDNCVRCFNRLMVKRGSFLTIPYSDKATIKDITGAAAICKVDLPEVSEKLTQYANTLMDYQLLVIKPNSDINCARIYSLWARRNGFKPTHINLEKSDKESLERAVENCKDALPIVSATLSRIASSMPIDTCK